MYKKKLVTFQRKICTVRFFSVVERLEIFGRQVEPRWEGAETVSEAGTRALGLRGRKYINILINIING